MSQENVAVIFSGGVALGAYHAGAYAALDKRPTLRTNWVAGSSIGAVTAAVIAGNPPHSRVERLQALWKLSATARTVDDVSPLHHWRHLENWSSAIRTRLAGSAGQFRPRSPTPWGRFKSIYDLEPLRASITQLVDFNLLNRGEMRLTVATTDVETGDLVLFDNARGDRIATDHLLASCGFLPEFAPVEIDGRLLGDGGLTANAPIEALYDRSEEHLKCFVLDLFARDGDRPMGLESALARKSDLMFANQTWQRLEAYCRAEEGKASHAGTTIYYLSYRPDRTEAGPERLFDYSERTIESRWAAGEADMEEAFAPEYHRAYGTVALIPIRRGKVGFLPALDSCERNVERDS